MTLTVGNQIATTKTSSSGMWFAAAVQVDSDSPGDRHGTRNRDHTILTVR